jgi:hypothetical protein
MPRYGNIMEFATIGTDAPRFANLASVRVGDAGSRADSTPPVTGVELR